MVPVVVANPPCPWKGQLGCKSTAWCRREDAARGPPEVLVGEPTADYKAKADPAATSRANLAKNNTNIICQGFHLERKFPHGNLKPRSFRAETIWREASGGAFSLQGPYPPQVRFSLEAKHPKTQIVRSMNKMVTRQVSEFCSGRMGQTLGLETFKGHFDFEVKASRDSGIQTHFEAFEFERLRTYRSVILSRSSQSAQSTVRVP